MKVSFEFFPPNTEQGLEKLLQVAEKLESAQPEYFSVTYGAGGSTQEKTLATVRALCQRGYEVAPHLSCVGASRDTIDSLVGTYLDLGIKRIVALRGDLPSGMVQGGDFRFASDLVQYLRQKHGNSLHIEVASYPEVHPSAISHRTDLAALQTKFANGANAAITQFFYNADAYLDHVQQARQLGINQPIVPGIMPIHNFSSISRFAEGCGAEIPRWLTKRMQEFGDDSASIKALGLDVVERILLQVLASGARGVHFYTMNQSELSLELFRRIKQ
jgi:methylenetetrahydrofolate reductase (NADPH)